MDMTITRALQEIKLLSDRIERKICETYFIAANKENAKKVNTVYTKEQFVENAKSGFQSIQDLIERRKKIKSAIVASNAITDVVINGKIMKVSDAIERKSSISFEKDWLREMERQYNSAVAKVNVENEKVKQKLDEFLVASLGKEGKSKASEEEIKAISDGYISQWKFELINPLELQRIISDMKDDIENFEAEADLSLSEINAITKIVID